MQGKSLAKLLGIILIIGILGYIAYVGVKPFNREEFGIGAKYIRQGLDLKGGVFVVYQPQLEPGKVPTPEQMNSAKAVIRKRLDSRGLMDANVTVDTNNRLIVEIPGIKDTQEAIEYIGKTAKLQFKDPDGNVIIEGNDIVDAKSEKKSDKLGETEWIVLLKFTPEASKKFADATDRVSKLASQNKNYIGIYLDDKLISNPRVNYKIDTQEAIIEGGGFTAQSSEELASLIRSGALPFSLKPVQVEGVGPILGPQALHISIMAGIVAFILVCLFMLLWYRLPGLIASIALAGYVALTILILSGFKITLTLLGIAGIILSIGMAVDANIIIFERLKEELKAGKTLRGAVEAGFKRAFRAIFDGNMTTVIVGLVLLWFGTALIKGFAITLTIGVLLSFFSAITVTRYMLLQVMSLGLRQTWLYGYKGGATNA